MHGYQIMQAIAERTGQAWRVSPGAVYPTLAALEDEGLVRTEVGGGRKLATLTAEGIAHLADPRTAPADPFGANDAPPTGMSLRDSFESLTHAGRAIGRAGTPAQLTAARAVLEQARRELYLILAEDQAPTDGPVTGP
jgi:DNA-binding PadR family transcriptional regulator